MSNDNETKSKASQTKCDGNTGLRRRSPQTTVEYLEERQPDFETATMELLRMIRQDKPKSDLMEMVDYISEFWQETDPVAMGWVGADGRP